MTEMHFTIETEQRTAEINIHLTVKSANTVNICQRFYSTIFLLCFHVKYRHMGYTNLRKECVERFDNCFKSLPETGHFLNTFGQPL